MSSVCRIGDRSEKDKSAAANKDASRSADEASGGGR
jgi:hypothetical protein